MHLNLKGWKDQLKQKAELAKFLYRNFRIYDFGSYALNRLTPKQGYTVQKNVAYGLKARHRLDLYRSSSPRQQRRVSDAVVASPESSRAPRSNSDIGFKAATNRAIWRQVVNLHGGSCNSDQYFDVFATMRMCCSPNPVIEGGSK